MKVDRRCGGWRWTAALVAVLPALAYSIAGPPDAARIARTRETGLLRMTGPSSGAPIAVWSQFDGSARKLAWSRIEQGRWSPPRFLTFGPGEDLAPVAGTSNAGSLLFWIDARDRIFYAPFDPEAGRLFAVPRPIQVPPRHRQGSSLEGGSDAPVILGNCEKSKGEPCVGPASGEPIPSTPPPSTPGLDGGTDIPVVLSTGTTGTTTITLVSTLACGTQVLSIASGGIVTVVAVDASGHVTVLARYMLDPDTDPADATGAAGTYFYRVTCR